MDPDPGVARPPDLEHIAMRLRRLLAEIDAAPPFVLVGHSFGGDLARFFAHFHPEETAGLVLLDPVTSSPEDFLTALEEIGAGPELAVEAVRRVVYPEIPRVLLQALDQQGPAAAIQWYLRLKEWYPPNRFREDLLNRFGYRLLRSDRYEDAIAVFRLNTEEYPQALNPWDSLADAYLRAGKDRATVLAFLPCHGQVMENPPWETASRVSRPS